MSCGCGCGRSTNIASRDNASMGHVKGEPYRYASGHNRRTGTSGAPYKSQPGSKQHEHAVVAARALGRPLPAGAEVHHVNGDGRDNRGANLVICQDRAYHFLLHVRQRAVRACGNPDWRKCVRCKAYGDLGGRSRHLDCDNAYQRAMNARPGTKTKSCAHCGGTFQAKRNRTKACSPSCGASLAAKKRYESKEAPCLG